MGRDEQSLEEHARKHLNCHKQTIKGDSGEGSEEESFRESDHLLRQYLVGVIRLLIDMGGKGHFDDASMEMRSMLGETRGKAIML